MRASRLRALLATAVLLAAVPAAAMAPVMVLIAPGVYALPGRNALPAPDNGGAVGNAGYVIGPLGVVAFGAGASKRDGERLLAAIRANTALPLRGVLIPQALPEFVLGASVFQALGVPVAARQATVDLLRARCERCLQHQRELAGAAALAGTELPAAPELADAGIDTRSGRRLRLLAPGWSASPGDLALFDEASGTLFAGALVESGRLPLLRDGQLAGWLATLDEFRRLPVRHVVPGHGPVGDVGLIDDTRAYLLALDAEVRAHYARGDSLSETIAAVAMPRWRGLIGYADWHRANVQRAYQLLEERELADVPR